MDELLSLLQVADVKEVQVEALLELVQAALDGCVDDDPRYDCLVEIEDVLLAGRLPVDPLQAFRRRFPLSVRSDAELLEEEFHHSAKQLTDEEWQTSFYVDLVAALQDMNDDDLEEYLTARRQAVESALQGYRATSLTPSEVTAETWVGHRLLNQGLEAWLRALQRVTQDPDGEWEQALEEAEYGTRLLVAVQNLHQRVVSAQRK
ncbi:hypothetical protein IV102_21150 [bacterium]|nr:hypothetical protein [bacterium]